MNKTLRYLIIFFCFLPFAAKAQFETFKDSVVQLYGIVMTADSLKGLPSVSVVVKGQNRGCISNESGVFSIVVVKGDKVEFTCIGFKPKTITIPTNLVGNQQSIIQLMVNDTIYLAATIIRARPSREEFERDFLNTKIPDDNIAIARKNTDAATRRMLMSSLPVDGREAGNRYLRQQAYKASYSGQIPPMNIFSPLAWAEFIQAWKRGDFRNNN